MKQIKAIPKLVFDKHFTDKEFKYYDYACFISILDIDNNEQKFDKSIDNFLQVKMWDIEEDLFENGYLKYEKPNDNELKMIVDFINKHKDKSVFMVHCSAGISRSGAVATFLFDKFSSCQFELGLRGQVCQEKASFFRQLCIVLTHLFHEKKVSSRASGWVFHVQFERNQ